MIGQKNLKAEIFRKNEYGKMSRIGNTEKF